MGVETLVITAIAAANALVGIFTYINQVNSRNAKLSDEIHKTEKELNQVQLIAYKRKHTIQDLKAKLNKLIKYYKALQRRYNTLESDYNKLKEKCT